MSIRPEFGGNPYRAVVIRRTGGKIDKVEIENGSEKENEEINQRLQGSKDNGLTEKMSGLAKDRVTFESSRWFYEREDGSRVQAKPMPPSAVGLTENDPTNRKKIEQEVREKLQVLYRQEPMDMGAVKDLFNETFEFVRKHLIDNGYTEYNNVDNMRQAVSDVYNNIRREINWAAEYACRMEGQEKYPTDYAYGTIYYNSDYYYKVEDVKDVLAECAKDFSDKYSLGEPNLEMPKRMLAGDYINFNTCWSKAWSGNDYAGINTSEPPPKNFSFAWQTKIDSTDTVLELRLDDEVWSAANVQDRIKPGKHTAILSEIFPEAGRKSSSYAAIQRFLSGVHVYTPAYRYNFHGSALHNQFQSVF